MVAVLTVTGWDRDANFGSQREMGGHVDVDAGPHPHRGGSVLVADSQPNAVLGFHASYAYTHQAEELNLAGREVGDDLACIGPGVDREGFVPVDLHVGIREKFDP